LANAAFSLPAIRQIAALKIIRCRFFCAETRYRWHVLSTELSRLRLCVWLNTLTLDLKMGQKYIQAIYRAAALCYCKDGVNDFGGVK